MTKQVVGKKHKYLSNWYVPGDDFLDKAHQEWACLSVRNYGVHAKPEKKSATPK